MAAETPSNEVSSMQASKEKQLPEEFKYKNACGPIAAYVALKFLNQPVTLQQIANDCGWSSKKATSLKQIQNAIIKNGFFCTAQKLTPKKLYAFLVSKRGVAILPIRKKTEKIDHALVAIDANQHYITTIDYPELIQEKYIDEIADEWDGHTLLVTQAPIPVYTAVFDWSYFYFPSAAFCLIAGGTLHLHYRRNAQEDKKISNSEQLS